MYPFQNKENYHFPNIYHQNQQQWSPYQLPVFYQQQPPYNSPHCPQPFYPQQLNFSNYGFPTATQNNNNVPPPSICLPVANTVTNNNNINSTVLPQNQHACQCGAFVDVKLKKCNDCGALVTANQPGPLKRVHVDESDMNVEVTLAEEPNIVNADDEIFDNAETMRKESLLFNKHAKTFIESGCKVLNDSKMNKTVNENYASVNWDRVKRNGSPIDTFFSSLPIHAGKFLMSLHKECVQLSESDNNPQMPHSFRC